MPYTRRDSPAITERIRRDLDTILGEVRRADPALRSLVLTGGYARGEGAVRAGAPQNDYDLIAIRRPTIGGADYAGLRRRLEAQIGLEVDLAPVAALRLRWVARSIFWYETALRGRVLWGEDLLGRIPVRRPEALRPSEGLRLLANRAAGLLLVAPTADPRARRLQAAKAILGANDAHLLSTGRFAPSQTERWDRFRASWSAGPPPTEVLPWDAWVDWAYRYKTDPERAPERDASDAWRVAAHAVRASVGVALGRAGLRSLDAYARRDGVADHLVYLFRSRHVPGARRLVLHPTGRLRVATLELLGASLDGRVRDEAAQTALNGFLRNGDRAPPLSLLAQLRAATLP